MAFDIDEEQVFPQNRFAWAAFKFGHGNAQLGERLQQRSNGTGTVGRGYDQRGFIVAAAAGFLMTHHQEARGVVRFVFNALSGKAQLINFRGNTSGNGGHIRAVRFSNQTRCFGIAGHGDTLGIGQIAAKPVVALRQGLGMGENLGNAADFVAVFTQQVVMDADNHFAAGFQRSYCQQVQSAPH